jgi:hypothetical protein
MKKLSLLSLVVVIALVLSACGDQATTLPPVPTTAPPPATPTPEIVASPTPPGPAPRNAEVGEYENDVKVRASEVEDLRQAEVGDTLNVGGQLLTGDSSKARLDFSDGAIVRIGPSSSFVVQDISGPEGNVLTRLKIEIGKIWISLTSGAVEVETPIGTASVRGSYAVFEYDPGDPDDPTDDVLIVSCVEGDCNLKSDSLDEDAGDLEELTLNGEGELTRVVLTGEDVEEFIRENPEVGDAIRATLTAAAPTATATDTETATPLPTDTPAPTDTRRPPTRVPPTATITNTPLPNCTPPEFFDPFLNRCRLPDPTPYGGLVLQDSPLYQALAKNQRTLPVGLASAVFAVVGILVVGWGYRKRNRS